jgi:hypothetical protein
VCSLKVETSRKGILPSDEKGFYSSAINLY